MSIFHACANLRFRVKPFVSDLQNLEYNDIILNMDYIEHYGNTSWKVIDVFDHGVKSKAPFVMKVSQDYIHQAVFFSLVETDHL